MTVVPTIRQIKLKGKPVGNHYIVLNGEKINLKTKNYLLARERAIQAVEEGKRDFPEEGQRALSPVSSGNQVPSDWSSDLHAAASGSSPPEFPSESPTPRPAVVPDEIYPPTALPSIEPPTVENAPGDAPRPEDFTNLPPDMLDAMLQTAAEMLVQLQLDGQAFLIRKMAKREAGILEPNDGTRVGAIKIWKGYLQTAVPSNVPLPPYLVAPLLILAFGATEQLAKSSPLKDEKGPKMSVVP
jgi:hypothetical protein